MGIEESSSSPWSDLMEELLEDIASRLLLQDYLRFSAVCKRWQSVRHQTDRYASSSSQWLMVLSKKDGECELTDPSCSNKSTSYKLQFPELLNSTILYSRDGWLLAKGQEQLFFFDPFTTNKLDLPAPEYCSLCIHLCSAAFSASPDSPDCVATVICKHNTYFTPVIIHTWRPGDDNWTRTCLEDLDTTTFRLNTSFPIMSHGGFISQGMEPELRVIDPSSHDWRLIDMRGVTELERDWEKGDITAMYTTEFDGELFLVCVGATENSVGVYKMNPSTKEAKRIKNLGGLTIYVDKRMAIMAPATTPEMANRILFLVNPSESGVQYYSMEAGEYCPGMQFCMGMELLKMAQREYGCDYWWREGDLLRVWVEAARFKAQGL